MARAPPPDAGRGGPALLTSTHSAPEGLPTGRRLPLTGREGSLGGKFRTTTLPGYNTQGYTVR